MKPSRFLTFGLFILFAAFYGRMCPCMASAGGPGPTPEIQQLEDAILTQRRLIVSGHIRVSREFTDLTGPRRIDEQSDIITYFDATSGAKRIREDLTQNGISTVQCFDGTLWYWYRTGPASSNGTRYSLGVKELTSRDLEGPAYLHQPVLLMLHPLWYKGTVGFHMEQFIGSPQRRGFSAAPCRWENTDAWKVSFEITRAGGAAMSYWVVPSWGYSVVKMELKSDDDGVAKKFSVQCAVKEVAKGIWFPSEVHWQDVAGEAWKRKEDLRIEVVSINRPIDQSIFGPGTMGIPPGTDVARVVSGTGSGPLKWDGKAIVPRSREEALARLAVPDGSGHRLRPMVMLATSLLLALAGLAGLWWRHLRSRRVTSN